MISRGREAVGSTAESFEGFLTRNVRRLPFFIGILLAFFLIRSMGVRAMPILLIGSSAALIPLSVLRPEYGLYALILNNVNGWDSYYGLQQYLPISLPILYDAAIGMGILAQLGRGRRFPRLGIAQNQLLVAYILLVGLSAMASDVVLPGYWARFRTTVLIRPIIYLFILILIQEPRQLHRLLLSLFVGHTFLMMTSMSNWLQKGGRIQGSLPEVNMLAYECIVMLPLLISIAVYVRNRSARYAMVALSLVTLFVSLQTLSRSAYYAFGATMLFLVARFTRSPRTFLMAAGFAVFFYFLVPAQLTQRLEAVTDITETNRYILTRIGIRMAVDNPVLGVGWGGWEGNMLRYDYEQLLGRPKAPHSLYSSVAAESGIPALLVYIAMFSVCLLQAVRLDRRYTRAGRTRELEYAIAIGVQGALIGHFVFGTAGSYANSYYAFLLLALSVLVGRSEGVGESAKNPIPRVVRGAGTERRVARPGPRGAAALRSTLPPRSP